MCTKLPVPLHSARLQRGPVRMQSSPQPTSSSSSSSSKSFPIITTRRPSTILQMRWTRLLSSCPNPQVRPISCANAVDRTSVAPGSRPHNRILLICKEETANSISKQCVCITEDSTPLTLSLPGAFQSQNRNSAGCTRAIRR